MYQPLRRPVSAEMSREDRIEHLIQYFGNFLTEDRGPDGTAFDCAVFDAIRSVGQKFPEKEQTKR